jgi:hypothetical protein
VRAELGLPARDVFSYILAGGDVAVVLSQESAEDSPAAATAAFAAWEHHAIDFLLKPYSPQRLAKTVAKLRVQVAGRAVLAVVPPPLAVTVAASLW